METIILTKTGMFRDGGSLSFIGSDDNLYWQNNRIGHQSNPTYGKICIGDPNGNGVVAEGIFDYEGKIFKQ